MEDYTPYISPCQDEIFTKFSPKKGMSLKLSQSYLRIADWFPSDSSAYSYFFRKHYKVHDCGSWLEFTVGPDTKKLSHAYFCKDRLCPMCNWRRSLKVFGQISRILQHTGDDYRYLFLTLTVRNVEGSALSDTITRMFKAWDKILHSKFYKSCYLGAIRVLEVTYNQKADTYHPHLHITLAVGSDYFHKKYVSRDVWLNVWQDAYGDPLITQVDIRSIYKKAIGANPFEYASAVAEMSKYAIKFHDLPSDECIFTLTSALYHRRLITFSGVFFEARKAMKLDDPVDGDLVHVEDDSTPEAAVFILRFQWSCGYSFYRAVKIPSKK